MLLEVLYIRLDKLNIMYPIIYKYFILHKKLSIPGIGLFSINYQPAKFNDAGNILYPPEQVIAFSKETALADKHFFAYLAKELHTEQVDAIKNFHDFAYQLHDNISKTEGAVLHGIGTLKKQPSGDYIFEAENNTKDYFTSLTLHENTTSTSNNVITHQHTNDKDNFNDVTFLTPEELADEEEATKKDYWWILAIALGIIGIAAILYKQL
jgi:hypothetical protein